MQGFYNPNQHWPLRKLLDQAARNGATILIPDLQRSFVWTPDQIILLVDSIFRGWPFGSILTWKYVTNDVENATYGIPARGFYSRYSRVPPQDKYNISYTPASNCYFTDSYTMVLDGQQRLQSLILAFYPETRFRLRDYDWFTSLHPDEAYPRRNQHYSTGMLCLDVTKYLEEIRAHDNNCDAITVSSCLEWVMPQDSDGCSPRRVSTKYPLPSLQAPDRHFIPLYVLWEKSKKTDDVELLSREVKPVVATTLHAGKTFSENDYFLLAKFIKQLNHIGMIDVHCLEINPCNYLSDTPEEQEKEQKIYDDAIVDIFTRLNTAGRALSNQEITYAWLKRGWKGDRQTFAKASALVDSIRDDFSFLNISDDDAIALLSTIWCVNQRENGKPLARRDFLKGQIVRPMATYLSEGNRPDFIAKSVHDFAALAAEVLEGSYLSSFNAVQVAFMYYMEICAGKDAIIKLSRQRTTQIDALEEKTKKMIRRFMDRWLYASAFSGKWAKDTAAFFEVLCKLLSGGMKELHDISSEEGLSDFANRLAKSIMDTVLESAISSLKITVSDRSAVSQYRTRLVAWQRMDSQRAKFRDLTFGEKGGEALQVDHIIPCSGWEDFVDAQFKDGKLKVEEAFDLFQDDLPYEKDFLLKPENADVALATAKAVTKAFINNIGNCSFLKWRYNGSKNRTNYDDFMKNVYEVSIDPKFLSQWATSMFLTEPFLHPFTKESGYKDSVYKMSQFVSAIREREAIIISDLKSFISGEMESDYLF